VTNIRHPIHLLLSPPRIPCTFSFGKASNVERKYSYILRDEDDDYLYGGSSEPPPQPTGKNSPSKNPDPKSFFVNKNHTNEQMELTYLLYIYPSCVNGNLVVKSPPSLTTVSGQPFNKSRKRVLTHILVAFARIPLDKVKTSTGTGLVEQLEQQVQQQQQNGNQDDDDDIFADHPPSPAPAVPAPGTSHSAKGSRESSQDEDRDMTNGVDAEGNEQEDEEEEEEESDDVRRVLAISAFLSSRNGALLRTSKSS
jgi:hypothetical protein